MGCNESVQKGIFQKTLLKKRLLKKGCQGETSLKERLHILRVAQIELLDCPALGLKSSYLAPGDKDAVYSGVDEASLMQSFLQNLAGQYLKIRSSSINERCSLRLGSAARLRARHHGQSVGQLWQADVTARTTTSGPLCSRHYCRIRSAIFA